MTLTKRTGAIAVAVAAAVVTPMVVSVPAAHAAPVPSALSLHGVSAGSYGSTVSLFGTLSRRGSSTKIPNGRVYLQRSPHGKNTWRIIASAVTSRNGTYRFGVKHVVPYDYRTYYPGSAAYARTWSRTRYVAVVQTVVFDQIRTMNFKNGWLRANGRVYPAPPKGAPVYLLRWNGRAWQVVGGGKAAGGGAAVGVNARVHASSTYYRLYVPKRGIYGAGWSNLKSFKHYQWRGAFVKPLLAKGGTPGWRIRTDAPDDPERRLAAFWSGDNGFVWADINTVGCDNFNVHALNYANGRIAVALLNGSRVLDATTMPRPVGGEPSEVDLLASAKGLSRIRIRFSDVDSTQGPESGIWTNLLCAN